MACVAQPTNMVVGYPMILQRCKSAPLPTTKTRCNNGAKQPAASKRVIVTRCAVEQQLLGYCWASKQQILLGERTSTDVTTERSPASKCRQQPSRRGHGDTQLKGGAAHGVRLRS